MAFKRIEQDFILSDSSTNVYGFRLLTSGFLMDEFLKNPIGYYNHEGADGVLVKWEDVRLDGDKIVGKPVINMEHPRAERTIKEIADGFLNAASVGNICVLTYELVDNPDDAEQPIFVGTKWYNKECSLVDSPGNRNAFKAGLYDANEKEINLSDLVFNSIQNKKSTMKKITLPLTAAIITMLSLGDDPTEAQVSEGIENLFKGKEKAVKDLSDFKADLVKQTVKDLLDGAMAANKISAKQREILAKDYATNPDALKDLLDSMGFTSIMTKLNQQEKGQNITPQVQNLIDKGWDKLMEEGLLPGLKASNEPAYLAVYKKRFGYEPNQKPKPKK